LSKKTAAAMEIIESADFPTAAGNGSFLRQFFYRTA
jgi:hypothetical protein